MTAKLRYVEHTAPAAGNVKELAPDLFWALFPLPFRLNHVNVWLLKETDGWTVIDTGCDTSAIRAAWETLLAGPMAKRPIRRLIATHGHVDHIGLAGWLVKRFDAEFAGTFAEWVWARLSHMHDVPDSNAAHLRFLLRHGFETSVADAMVRSRERFINLAQPIPGAITEIRDGQTVRFGDRDWRVIVTRGHANEHAAFHCARDNILIVGDHLLPSISPVIAVSEMTPESDPLGDYLASFAQFDEVPDDALVLPSHGQPYRGIRTRIAELRAHHITRLNAVLDLSQRPRNAFELASALFPHVDGAENVGFALGETLAHVNHLVKLGKMAQHTDGSGKLTFTACCTASTQS